MSLIEGLTPEERAVMGQVSELLLAVHALPDLAPVDQHEVQSSLNRVMNIIAARPVIRRIALEQGFQERQGLN